MGPPAGQVHIYERDRLPRRTTSGTTGIGTEGPVSKMVRPSSHGRNSHIGFGSELQYARANTGGENVELTMIYAGVQRN